MPFIISIIGIYISNVIYNLSYLVIKNDNINLKILKSSFHRNKDSSIKKYVFQGLFSTVYFMIALKYGITVLCFKYLILISFLMLISIIDYYTTDIYSGISYSAILISLLFIGFSFLNHNLIFEYIAGGVTGFAIILLISFVSRGGIGNGDADIFLLVGLNIGLYLLTKVFIITFIVSGAVCIYRVITKKRGYVPLTPFITLATLIVLMLKYYIIN